ncbi:MAG: AraC family transcriptional regulator [Bacteroidales bacterium]|nr:AraC family transcriptional regulator [Bacteroidales bacterium]
MASCLRCTPAFCQSSSIHDSLRSVNPATAGCSLQKPTGLFAYRSRGLDISTHYLSRIIHQQTGRTIKDWIADTLMVEIKYHLTCTDKTIEEISEDLSFCSTSAFIQYFKSKTGCTPFKYRRDQNLKTQ